MSMIDPIPPGTECADCREHAATEIYADEMMGAIHGFISYLCLCCCLKRQIARCERVAAQLPRLKADLEGACQ